MTSSTSCLTWTVMLSLDESLKTHQMNFHEHLLLVQLTDCCLCPFPATIASHRVPTSHNRRWNCGLQKCKKHFSSGLQRQPHWRLIGAISFLVVFIFYFARGSRGEVLWWACLSVCVSVCASVSLSVCPTGYLRNHTRDLYQYICAYYLWPWLGRPPAGWRNPKGRGNFGVFHPTDNAM